MASKPPPPPSSSSGRPRSTFIRTASTSSEFENVYRYVDTKFDAVRSEVNAVRTEMKAEVATVMAEFKSAEAQRSTDYRDLSGKLDSVTQSLPSKSTFVKMGFALFGGILTAAALAWAIFDTGAGITSSFADQVLDDKKQQDQIESKLDQLLEEKTNVDAEAAS